MNNPRITAKERNLIKGALRRVFSRSELRNSILEAAIIAHSDVKRPKVKKWFKCAICKKPEAKSYAAIDHISPLVPLALALADMSWDTVIDCLWCSPGNLQALCPDCHDIKTKAERKERNKNKKEKKNK